MDLSEQLRRKKSWLY